MQGLLLNYLKFAGNFLMGPRAPSPNARQTRTKKILFD